MANLLPTDLRCEMLAEPKGLNTDSPRFSWALTSEANGEMQTAYEICVGDSQEDVANGIGNYWQSGKIRSDEQAFLPYGGRPLTSDLSLFWSVQVWDNGDNPSQRVNPQPILTGIMSRDEWCAQWIARYFVLPAGREIPADNIYDNPWQARPADYFRKDFQSRGSLPLIRATAYVTAFGLYELYLNGNRIGDEVMAPGWTDYHQRVIYTSHDVTEHIQANENTIGAILGEGWYSGRVGHNQRKAGNHYGGRPALFCQLHLTYANGSTDIISTDDNWHTHQGPICYSDFLMGEHYDARLELDGWASPGFDQTSWQPVEAFAPEPHEPLLTAPKSQPARETTHFPSTYLGPTKSGNHIFDFGQNFAGYTELSVIATSGQKFTIRHAEILDPDGELYTTNLRHAVAIDHFTARGTGSTETFKPRFTFHGFRFVELALPSGFSIEDVHLTGIAVHSDTPLTGSLETGNTQVNQLISNIEWSQRGNFLSVPTDCPQRDERLGWSADAQVFWRSAGYIMDVSAFLAKWYDDIIDAQLPDGAFTDIAPSRPLNPYRQSAQPGAPGWGDAPIIIGWQHYLRYGDKGLLAQHFPALQHWMKHIADANPNFLRINAVYNNYGDWLNVGPSTDRTMVATAYWVHIADLMEKISSALGEKTAAANYADLAKNIRAAFCNTFVDENGNMIGETQTTYLLAIDFDILPEANRQKAANSLLKNLNAADGHLQTGFLGVKHLCPVLTDIGAPENAYKLLLNDTYPSWGFSIIHGATTIWERWDGWTPEKGFQSANMNSFNHYAYGAVAEWLYGRVAGIDWDERTPGFKSIKFRPLFNNNIGWVKAHYRATTGLVRSAWRFGENVIFWEIEIPPNCTGSIELPFATNDIIINENSLAEQSSNIAHEDGITSFTLGSGQFNFMISYYNAPS